MSYGRRENQLEFFAKKSIMVSTSGYRDVYARSYQANIQDTGLIDDFAEITYAGQHVDPVSLARIASRIVQPQAQSGSLIDIDGGFSERRLVFMISIEYKDARSAYPKTTIVSGYTDILDVTYQGTINPDTRFYINSVVTLNTVNDIRAVNIDHLITSKVYSSRGYNNDYGRRGGSLITMRPTDVLSDIRNAHYDGVAINTTNHISAHKSMKSRRRNGLASRYLSDIFRPVKTVDPSLSQNVIGFDDYTSLDQAAAKIRESSISSDAFTRRLRTYVEFIEDGYVTWGDLCDIIHELDERTVVSMEADKVSRFSNRARDSETWHGADNETITATMINQSLSAIMATCLVTYLECEFTNETIDGRPMVKIINLTTFDELMDPRRQAEVITGVIEDELMPILTHNNEFLISASVQFDLMTECFISVSFEQGPYIDFVAPTFCDALYSPVVTDSEEILADVSRTISGLLDRTVMAPQLTY